MNVFYLNIIFNKMILNILVLLFTNILIPLLHIPSQFCLPLPIVHFFLREPSVFQHMQLNRLHTKEQFKKSFRDSLKALHPDRGGNQQAFSKVKGLKKIMEQKVDYYDTLNITDADLEYNIPLKEIVNIKSTTYFVQAGIYYFIVLLFVLAYTIEDQFKAFRKILLPLIIVFAVYEFYIHFNPEIPTIIDLFYGKMPIFAQKALLKTVLSTLISYLRAKASARPTLQKTLIKQIQNLNSTEEQYRDSLQKLSVLYTQKAKIKSEQENSWGSKIRGWISKGFTILMIFSLAKGFFSGGGDKQL